MHVDTEELHRLRLELRRREDEIQDLQHSLANALQHVQVEQQRSANIKMDYQQMMQHGLEDIQKINFLSGLALSGPEITYFCKTAPGLISQDRKTHQIHQPSPTAESETLRETINSLRERIAQHAQHFNAQIAVLEEDRRAERERPHTK